MVAGLSEVNLNLLLALQAILETRSVTKAAVVAGVSQSAMSHTLRQLRILLDDPLLVRAREGMVLTPRALSLTGPLSQGLSMLQQALRTQPYFDPLTVRRRFSMVTSDSFALFFLPVLIKTLSEVAPGVDIDVRPAEVEGLAHQLESGEVQLGVVAYPDDQPSLRCVALYRETFACAVRNGHPAISSALDLETYVRLSHLLISPRGKGPSLVDTALAARGLTRRVGLRIPFFGAAAPLVAGTDLIVTAPRRLLSDAAASYGLHVLEPPVDLPDFSVVLLWHERYENDPALAWLRGLIQRLVQEEIEEDNLRS